MPVDPALRSLNIDIPSQPESLVTLSTMLADENINLQAVSALISADGCGSITMTRLASSPRASHPVSIAPPILPAPASAMVPWMFARELAAVIDDM